MIKAISPHEAKQMLDAHKAILIDVREREEYDEVHIENALLYSLSELPQKVHEINIPLDKEIIIHCRKGPRGDKAAIIFQLAGYDLNRFYNMDGGITAWEENGLPVVRN